MDDSSIVLIIIGLLGLYLFRRSHSRKDSSTEESSIQGSSRFMGIVTGCLLWILFLFVLAMFASM